MRLFALTFVALLVPVSATLGEPVEKPAAVVEKPAALVADGSPEIPRELAARTRPYLEYRTAYFLGWHPTDRSMLIVTRFGNTSQVHRVARPEGARVQISFASRVAASSFGKARFSSTAARRSIPLWTSMPKRMSTT